MNRVCGLWLDPNIGLRPAGHKKFYLRLMVDLMHVFAVFTKKYFSPCGCNGSNFTVAVNCTNPNTEIQSEIIDTEIIKAQM